MKLQDLNLDVVAAVTNPYIRSAPGERWDRALEGDIIPRNLFRLFSLANYFSIDRIPRRLMDDDKLLHSFVAALVEGMQSTFEEIDDLLTAISADQGRGFNPIKKARGEEWDRKADLRQERNFKHLLALLGSTLDQFAELCAIYFREQLKSVQIGRAQFTGLIRGLKSDFALPTIASPIEELYAKMRDEVLPIVVRPDDAADVDWFEVFVLYRNKLTHIGSRMFPVMDFADTEGDFYGFIPREWPTFHQTGLGQQATDETIRQFVERRYVHIDMLEYAQGLVARIKALLDLGLGRICEAFSTTRDWEPDAEAITALRSESVSYRFTAFVDIID